MGIKQVHDLTGPSVPEVDPTKKPCAHCGYKTLKHARAWAEGEYLIYCTRCGYYRETVGYGFATEGLTFPCECSRCHRTQAWVRVLPFFEGKDKEALSLTYWTCDNLQCLTKQTVFESLITAEKMRAPAHVGG